MPLLVHGTGKQKVYYLYIIRGSCTIGINIISSDLSWLSSRGPRSNFPTPTGIVRLKFAMHSYSTQKEQFWHPRSMTDVVDALSF